MKKKLTIAVIVVAAVLLMPFRFGALKDGGSKTVGSLTWELTFFHRLNPIPLEGETGEPYQNGLRLKVLGLTVFDTSN